MRRRAYTLIEIGMVVVVAGIIIAVSMPDPDTKAKQEAETAATIFESDVAFARSRSIADPTDPVVIKLSAAANKYWLAKKSAPDTPLMHPQTGKAHEVKFGIGGKKGLENVQLLGNDFGGDSVLGFDSVGNTDQATAALFQISSKGATCEVQVKPAAGKTNSSETLTKTLTVEGTTPVILIAE
ncbi:MAG: type II secretion system protein [Planctomycetota bacterium]